MTLKEENMILKKNLADKTTSEAAAIKDSMRIKIELDNAQWEINDLKSNLETLKDQIKKKLFDEWVKTWN